MIVDYGVPIEQLKVLKYAITLFCPPSCSPCLSHSHKRTVTVSNVMSFPLLLALILFTGPSSCPRGDRHHCPKVAEIGVLSRKMLTRNLVLFSASSHIASGSVSYSSVVALSCIPANSLSSEPWKCSFDLMHCLSSYCAVRSVISNFLQTFDVRR